MFEAEPLGKLFGLFAMGHIWEAHGMQHPLGNDSQGFVDVIIHDLDFEQLKRHREAGTVQNWNDRRRDLYRVVYQEGGTSHHV